MGLALDEPREGDNTYSVEDLPLIVDPFALTVIQQSGGVSIKSGVFGPMAELNGQDRSACGHGH